MYTWKYAEPEEFSAVRDLFLSSGLGDNVAEIQRRITTPLILKQLITFYKNGKFCGFVTFAFLNNQAAEYMPTVGIHPQAWRSGSDFWAVDYAVNKGFDGYRMLRIITKELGVKQARYFRHKHREIREVDGTTIRRN